MTTDIDILKSILQLLEGGEVVALCTVIEKKGSGPRDAGAKMVVTKNGKVMGTIGGGSLERIIVEESIKALSSCKPRKIVLSLQEEGSKDAIKTGLVCGGEITVFIDVLTPRPRLVIFGAGHIALPLAKISNIVGFRVAVVDNNEQLANKERFPMVDEVIVGSFPDVVDSVKVSRSDFVVIANGVPEYDYMVLERVIKVGPAYVGLLGSKSKAATFIKRLKESGVKDEELRTLHAPVGIDIGAQTPEEIAVSIMAEMIRESRVRLA